MPLIVSIVDDAAPDGTARSVSDYANERLELDGAATVTLVVPNALSQGAPEPTTELDEALWLLAIADGVLISITGTGDQSLTRAFFEVTATTLAPQTPVLPLVTVDRTVEPLRSSTHDTLSKLRGRLLSTVIIPAQHVSRTDCGTWIDGDAALHVARSVRLLSRLSSARREPSSADAPAAGWSPEVSSPRGLPSRQAPAPTT